MFVAMFNEVFELLDLLQSASLFLRQKWPVGHLLPHRLITDTSLGLYKRHHKGLALLGLLVKL